MLCGIWQEFESAYLLTELFDLIVGMIVECCVDCGGAFGRWLGATRWEDEAWGVGWIDSIQGGTHQCSCSWECKK